MAAVRYKHFQSLLSIFKPTGLRWTETYRLYSQYAPQYQEPVIDKNKLNEVLEKTEVEELECLSIKAAENNQSCSVFYDEDVAKFTNLVMKEGKKEVARNMVEAAFLRIKHLQIRQYESEKDEEEKKKILLRPLDVFHEALKNTTPVLDLKKIKRSGTWYQVPVGIRDYRAKFYAMRWIITSAKDKERTTPFEVALADEILGASKMEGKAYKKKVDLHKLCETNRAYAHYTWT